VDDGRHQHTPVEAEPAGQETLDAANGSFPETPMDANLLTRDFAFSNEFVECRFRYLQLSRQLLNDQDIVWSFIHRKHPSGRKADLVSLHLIQSV